MFTTPPRIGYFQTWADPAATAIRKTQTMKLRLDLTKAEFGLLKEVLYEQTQNPKWPHADLAARKTYSKLESAWENASSKSNARR